MTSPRLVKETLFLISNLVADSVENTTKLLKSDLIIEIITNANHPNIEIKREAYLAISTILYCAD